MASASNNRLLASLSSSSRDLLLAGSTEGPYPTRSALYSADQPPAFAYFLTSGIASVVSIMPEGGIVEVGMIGCEGFTGAMHLLGPASVPTECFIQVAATAVKVRFSHVQKAFGNSPEIRSRILEFVQEFFLGVGQTSSCNRLHQAEERLARWLLMVQDRIQSNELYITQEFLAEMLGAQRTTVTLVAGTLQRAGLIEYRRGHITVRDRAMLEAAACSCYQVNQRLFQNLYNAPAQPLSSNSQPHSL